MILLIICLLYLGFFIFTKYDKCLQDAEIDNLRKNREKYWSNWYKGYKQYKK